MLFAILGAALLTMTFNGLAKNETRENTVQSIDLATKGEQYLIADINSRVAQFVENKNVLTNEVFHQEFLNLLKEYDCGSKTSYLNKLNADVKSGTSTGDSSICVDTKKVAPYDDTLTKFKVPLISTGKAGSKESVIQSTYLMGAQDVKESLKYSVSTFKNETEQGGNLILHGGSELQGNINVENNLFLTSYSYGLGRWLESVLPRAKGSKLFLGNNIYTLKNGLSNLNYSTHVNSNFTSTSLYKTIPATYYNPNSPTNLAENGFERNYAPALYKNEEENIFYKVSEDFKGLGSYAFSNRNTNKSERYNCTLFFFCDTWKYALINSTTTESSPISYNGDLYITNGTRDNKNISVTFKNAVYVKGDLIIGNLEYNANDPKTYHNITLDGKTIYVDGKVRVLGVNLTANTNIYVKGEEKDSYVKYNDSVTKGLLFPEVSETETSKLTTRFYELTLKGLNTTNTVGSIIVFSAGKLQIANISEYSPTPSILTGYFYSEGSMELYGFGSNLKIVGGVSANNLTLNAMRGDSLQSCSNKNNYQLINSYCFEKGTNQNAPGKNTRLSIEYNEKILDTYSKNQEGLFSNISQDDVIDEVRLLDRKHQP